MGRVRRMLEGAFEKLDEHNERSQAKAVAKLTPAERERYDMWTAHAEAARASEPVGDPRLLTAVLHGPAGEVVHGIAKLPKDRREIEDPGEWERQMRAELEARDAARAAYLAPGRQAVTFTRLATRPRSQVQDVAAHLATSGLAGRPDLVYGVYRVPDLISPGRLGGEPVVEWDVVHAATAPLPAAPAPGTVFLDARDVLVARAAGEPATLDEDLALHLLASAGIGPERTLGVAREVRFEHRGEEQTHSRLEGRVRGVHALVAGRAPDPPGGPWRLPEGPPAGVVVDVLQWDALAKAVHPVRQQRAPLPSPFPYLPLTPQELLRAYLEIVGVAPADACAVQVTYDRPFDLMGRTSRSGHVRRTGGGPELPCADGKPRKRMAGGHHLVVAYRDAPAYAEGRARFEAYAQGVLHAHLRRGVGVRAPVPKPDGRLMKTLDRVAGVVEFFTMDPTTEDGFVPPRYCWPPSVA